MDEKRLEKMVNEGKINNAICNRLNYVDVCKCFSCFAMILCHQQFFLPVSDVLDKTIIWFSTFHMPIFFILYGLVSKEFTDSFYPSAIYSYANFLQFLNKKIKSLIIPYLIWSCFYSPMLFENLAFILYGTNISLYYAKSNSVLWFLPAFFCSTVVFRIIGCGWYYTKKSKITNNIYIYILFVSIILIRLARFCNHQHFSMGCFWGIDIAFTGTLFMLLGYIIKPFVEKIIKSNMISILLLGSLIIINTIIAPLNYQYDGAKINGTMYIMAFAAFGKNYYIYIITALFGSIGMITLSSMFKDNKYLGYLGRYSIILMASHYFALSFSSKYISCLIPYNTYLAIFSNTFSSVLICIPIIILLKKYLPQAIGK